MRPSDASAAAGLSRAIQPPLIGTSFICSRALPACWGLFRQVAVASSTQSGSFKRTDRAALASVNAPKSGVKTVQPPGALYLNQPRHPVATITSLLIAYVVGVLSSVLGCSH